MKRYTILHHTATPKNSTSIPSILAYHQEKFGFSWYHYIITPTQTHQTRSDTDLNDRGVDKSLDIALTGNFETERPSAFQLKELRRLVNKYDYDIINHNEAVKLGLKASVSTCPIVDLKNLIKETMTFFKQSGSNTVYQLGEDQKYHPFISAKLFNDLYGEFVDNEIVEIEIPNDKIGYPLSGIII